jgi:sugar phosphate isomerase/epimerase
MDSVVHADQPVSAAARLGFAGIELTVEHSDLHEPRADALRGRAQAAVAAGVEVHALVLGDHNHGGIAAEDPDTARRAADEVRVAVGIAETLGAGVVLVPFFLEAELRSDEDVERCTRAFTELCPYAAERGVSLCFEGLLDAGRIRELAAHVSSPAFGCYFDLANPIRRGLDSPTELRALGPLVRRVHVKDMRVRAGDVHPGQGRVDFAECARALAEIGYDGWLTLETPPSLPPLVARDLSFTRAAFPTLASDIVWPRFGAFSYDHAAGEWERIAADFTRLGLDSVQLGGELLDECLADPVRGAERCAGLEQQVVSIAGIAGYRNLVSPDDAVRAANIDHLRLCLEVAPSLGTYVVATESGTRHPTGDWTDTPANWGAGARRLLDDALETLLPVAEEAGAILALEGYVKNVLKTQSQLLDVLERFPTPHLQVVCDPYNYLSGSLLPAQQRATSEFLDRFEDRFVVAHLKDVDPGGVEVASPAFGTGVFDQQPYLEFLRDRRPDLPLVLEHLALDEIPQAMNRVRESVDGVASA